MKNNINTISKSQNGTTAKWLRRFSIKSVAFAGLMLLASCETDLDKINENPNDQASVDPKVLLTYVSKNTF